MELGTTALLVTAAELRLGGSPGSERTWKEMRKEKEEGYIGQIRS
jgi:hypothetical protein